MNESTPHPDPLTFDEIQEMQATWPRVIGVLGDRINQVGTGYLGDCPQAAWRKHELDKIEGSMKMCEGCAGLPHCKQRDILEGQSSYGSAQVGFLYIPQVHMGWIQGALRTCKYERIRAQAKSKPWIEKRHAEMTFKGFVVTEANRPAFMACNKYVRNLDEVIKEGRGIVLSGATGVGKTHLASAIFQNAVLRGVQGSFTVVPAFLDDLRSRYGDNIQGEAASAYMAAILNSQLLVLDNMEIRNVTPWVIDTLFNIIDHRYRNLQATIVTTGWTAEQMAEVLEEKIPSRLVQLCKWYHVDEVDWRREDARKRNSKQGPRKGTKKS